MVMLTGVVLSAGEGVKVTLKLATTGAGAVGLACWEGLGVGVGFVGCVGFGVVVVPGFGVEVVVGAGLLGCGVAVVPGAGVAVGVGWFCCRFDRVEAEKYMIPPAKNRVPIRKAVFTMLAPRRVSLRKVSFTRNAK